jgi:hypothetical protein
MATRRSWQNALPLVILLIILIAAIIYFSRTSPAPQTGNAVASPAERAGPPDVYPIASLTPGATNPAITQDNIGETICNPHWSTRSIRPHEEYTNRLKREQMEEYGDRDSNPRDYEEDHLVPLELGGNPTDPKNLWPEPYDTSIPDGGAKYKDKVENYLHQEVCGGRIPLAQAQQQIAVDWYRVYVASIR